MLFILTWRGVWCRFFVSSITLRSYPWPIVNNRLRNARSHLSLRAGRQAHTSRRRDWQAERAWAAVMLGEPVTIMSRLDVLACVLGFCLHGLFSFASISQLPASLPQLLASTDRRLFSSCVLWCEWNAELAQQFSSCRERLPPDYQRVLPSLKFRGWNS